MTLVPGDHLRVASTKWAGTPPASLYDGSLHYRYGLTVVSAGDGELRAWGPAGTHLDSYRGSRPASRHMLHVHWTDRDYNLEVMWRPGWAPDKHYVNVALPSTWDDGALRFVDLDLDLIWRAGGPVVLDDEDEFDEHRLRFADPPELVERAWAAVAEVRDLMERRVPPFDGALYDWRPEPIPAEEDAR